MEGLDRYEKTKKTLKERHGANYWSEIGKLGGAVCRPTKGFGSNKDLAKLAGIKSGEARRKKANDSVKECDGRRD